MIVLCPKSFSAGVLAFVKLCFNNAVVSSAVISARRDDVLQAYNSAKASNNRLFLEGDDKATSEYIYPNQIQDANNIVEIFYIKITIRLILKLLKMVLLLKRMISPTSCHPITFFI